jgi:hypothetical protein
MMITVTCANTNMDMTVPFDPETDTDLLEVVQEHRQEHLDEGAFADLHSTLIMADDGVWPLAKDLTTVHHVEDYARCIQSYQSEGIDLDVAVAYAEASYGELADASVIQEAYVGSYYSDEDFARQFADDIGALGNHDWPHNCIDWEQAARDLMHDYAEEGGHYFRIS